MRKRRATRRPKPLRLVNRSLPAPGSPGGPHRRGTLRMPGIIADAQGTEANSSSFLAGSSRSLLSVRLFCHFAIALFGYTIIKVYDSRKLFGSFRLCGEGRDPETFLLSGQAAIRQKV